MGATQGQASATPRARTGKLGDDARSDATLAVAAAVGDRNAFEALYVRHAEAAWRVAGAVTANRHDAADAVADAFTRVLSALEAGRLNDGSRFRPYLLSATRNAAVDLHRRGGRVQPTGRLGDLDRAWLGQTAPERVEDHQDARLVAEAFRGLPERWRSVLWLTEVEGVSPRDAAGILGLSANNVSQLARRARAALRERFVQAHLRAPVGDDGCRFCVERLGGYVLGALSPRDVSKVDQHLAACAECRQRAAELEDLRTTLRRIVIPLPLLLGPAVAKWQLTGSAAAAPAVTSAAASGAAAGSRSFSSRLEAAAANAQKPLLAASTGIFALGIIGASVVGGPGDLRTRLLEPRTPAATAAAAPGQVVADRVVLATALAPPAFGSGDPSGATASADDAPDDADAGSPGPADERSGQTPATPGGGAADGPPPRREPLANGGAGVLLAGQRGGVSAGSGDGSCTGAAAGSLATGCPPPSAGGTTAGAVVATDGSAAGGAVDDRQLSVSV